MMCGGSGGYASKLSHAAVGDGVNAFISYQPERRGNYPVAR